MLHKFLVDHQPEILALAEAKTLRLAGLLTSSEELRKALPMFYSHLIRFLKDSEYEGSTEGIVQEASLHGAELLRLNYTLSHVVHAYGAMCQSITEYAQRKNFPISSQEFNALNLCLDVAIAAAVSEFQYRSSGLNHAREQRRLGFLVHELRNALSSATVASDMIRQGIVGTGGSTAKVLEDNLETMRKLIDRSLSEVRMENDPELHSEKFSLNALIDQILLTAKNEAKKKEQILESKIIDPIELETDRHLLLSAIANLVQNALKYTKQLGHIHVIATRSESTVRKGSFWKRFRAAVFG